MGSLAYTSHIKNSLSDFVVSSIIRTPNADGEFIANYNLGAKSFVIAADWCRLWGDEAGARFYGTLGVPIDTKKDIWEGLDYEVVMEMGKDRLLYVENKAGSDKHIYLNPPEAGHNSGIIHYRNDLEGSLALNALESANVWIMDKRNAGEEHAGFGLKDCIKRSVDSINYIAKETGEKVHVAGFCQGGWEGFIAAYLTQENCASLATGGTPFNWHSDDLSDLTRRINPANADYAGKIREQRDLIARLIDRNNGVMPGIWNLGGFIHLSREQLLNRDLKDLWKAAKDNNIAYMDRFAEFRPGWFMHPQSMGGKFYLDVFDEFPAENKLFNGELKVLGEKIDLGKFDLPMYSLNGKEDNITSLGQQMDLFRKIASVHRVEDSVEAGHIGLFNSRKAMPLWNDWFKTVTHPDFGKRSFSVRGCYEGLRRAA